MVKSDQNNEKGHAKVAGRHCAFYKILDQFIVDQHKVQYHVSIISIKHVEDNECHIKLVWK